MKVMLVDDERPLLREFANLLHEFPDYVVAGAYDSSAAALAAARELQPDLAFLDIEMPGMSGLQLAEALYAICPDTRIVFVTAYNHYATEAFEANAMDYLLKPVQPARLAKALAREGNVTKMVKRVPRVSICCFGKFTVLVDEKPLIWQRAKQRELVAFLLQHHSQWVDKYRITSTLWPDSPDEQALASLQTAVWAVRRLFRTHGIEQVSLLYAHDSYALTLGEAELDVKRFERLCPTEGKPLNAEQRNALRSCHGEGYLFQEDWAWAAPERARLERKFMQALWREKE